MLGGSHVQQLREGERERERERERELSYCLSVDESNIVVLNFVNKRISSLTSSNYGTFLW